MSVRTGRPKGERSLTIPCHFGPAALRRQGAESLPPPPCCVSEQCFAPCALDNAQCRELQCTPRSPHGVNVRGSRVGKLIPKEHQRTAGAASLWKPAEPAQIFENCGGQTSDDADLLYWTPERASTVSPLSWTSNFTLVLDAGANQHGVTLLAGRLSGPAMCRFGPAPWSGRAVSEEDEENENEELFSRGFPLLPRGQWLRAGGVNFTVHRT